VTKRKTTELENALKKKGFHKSNNHHEMYLFYYENKKTSVRTRLSHGAKEYSDNLLAQMAKQVKLDRSQFDDLIDCPLTAKGYVQHLIAKGHIRPPSN
jgi:hypothetical protein